MRTTSTRSTRSGPPATAAAETPDASTEPPPDDDEAVDLSELADAPDVPQPDSVTRLVAGLGAEVIDERRRG